MPTRVPGLRVRSGVPAVLAPVRLALAAGVAGLLPLAVSVAASLWPADAGEYWTATVHDFPGPSAVPVQASAVIEDAAESESEMLSIPTPSRPSW